jgi:NADP-dependent 3-hydroxy acid dehydrogenase YdfG
MGSGGRSREEIMSSSRSRPLALVTGASSGIGAAFAERLARDGYDLVLVARRRDRLEALAERLQNEAGAEAEPLAADLADAEALSQVEAQVASDERLALLVNNAGFGGYRPFVDVEPKVVDELIAVHVRAVARLTRAALPGMVRRGKGVPGRLRWREGVHPGLYGSPIRRTWSERRLRPGVPARVGRHRVPRADG